MSPRVAISWWVPLKRSPLQEVLKGEIEGELFKTRMGLPKDIASGSGPFSALGSGASHSGAR